MVCGFSGNLLACLDRRVSFIELIAKEGTMQRYSNAVSKVSCGSLSNSKVYIRLPSMSISKQKSRGGAVVSTPDPVS